MHRDSVEGAQGSLHVEEFSTLAPSPPVNEGRQGYPGSQTPIRSTSVVDQHTPTPIGLQERGGGAHGDGNIPTVAPTTTETVGPNASSLDHALVKDIIDTAIGNAFLHNYRSCADYFPFVLISPDIAVQDLAKEKPMLFLAICVTGSGKFRSLQSTSNKGIGMSLLIRLS